MRSEQRAKGIRPHTGLVVPLLTVLDERGELIEEDQRALVRYVIQGGQGADVVYAAAAFGEREHLSLELWRRLVRVCIEEVAKTSTSLLEASGRGVESWVGVTAQTRAQTLTRLNFAIESGADGIVLAPSAISDLLDPVRFVSLDVAAAFARLATDDHRPSLYLDDAIRGPTRIRVSELRAFLNLDIVRGIAASGRILRMGAAVKSAANTRAHGGFGIYAGEALHFDAFRPHRGVVGSVAGRWSRRQLGGALPLGVMAASANAFPREWARARQVGNVGETDRMRSCRAVLEAFRTRAFEAGGRRTIACYKRALNRLGVISSAAVARGTPALRYPDTERFDRAFEDVQSLAEEQIGTSDTSAWGESL